jgi:hypothetical protein
MNHNSIDQLLVKMTDQERMEVEAFAAFIIVRRKLQHTRVLTNDISVQELTELVLHGGGFDWLASEKENVYSIKDGEEVTWGDA